MRILLIACVVALSGCSSDLYVRTSAADRTNPSAGGSVSGGAVELRSPMTSLAVMLFGVHLVAQGQDAVPSAETPALDPGRSVSEQDCTRPVAESGGNLRCR